MRTHLSWLLVVSACLITDGLKPASGQEIHSQLCLFTCPLGGAPTDDLIIRDIYVLRSNDRTKFAEWVAFRVTRETIGPSPARTWRQDPLLWSHETLSPEDYRVANAVIGTDRGHQAPLASLAGTEFVQETNYLSNITPQQVNLNQGPWARLESAVRDLAQIPTVEAVYVLTGPLYERQMAPLPRAVRPHMVPSGYWKVVAILQGTTIRVAAFVMEQDAARNDSYCGFRTELASVERRSGYRMFYDYTGTFESLDAALGC